MTITRTSQFGTNGRTLTLFCVSLNGQDIPDWIADEAKRAFEALASFMENDNQVLYIRDIPSLSIEGKYPGGYRNNAYETMIALPDWQVDKQQVIATINHELYHMARWQNPGYGVTLGGAIMSEGLATYYEEQISGWSSPWSQAKVPDGAVEAALRQWNDIDYNRREWLFNGPFGKWVGYGIGYGLAKRLFEKGFDLSKSISIKADAVLDLLK